MSLNSILHILSCAKIETQTPAVTSWEQKCGEKKTKVLIFKLFCDCNIN